MKAGQLVRAICSTSGVMSCRFISDGQVATVIVGGGFTAKVRLHGDHQEPELWVYVGDFEVIEEATANA